MVRVSLGRVLTHAGRVLVNGGRYVAWQPRLRQIGNGWCVVVWALGCVLTSISHPLPRRLAATCSGGSFTRFSGTRETSPRSGVNGSGDTRRLNRVPVMHAQRVPVGAATARCYV